MTMNDNWEELAVRARRRIWLSWKTGLLLMAILFFIGLLIAYSSGASYGRQEILSSLASQQEQQTPEKTPPEITGDLLRQQLTCVPQLISSEYYYTNMGKFEDQADFYGRKVPFTVKRFIVSYDGRIQAGLTDLEELSIEIDQQTRKITVSLPPCVILSHEIFEDSLEVFDETSSIFNPIKIEDYAGFTADQKQTVEQKAIDGGFLTSADQQARQAVTALLSQMPGIEDYTLSILTVP